MTDHTDYSARIDVLRRAERVRSPEFVARIALMFIGTVAGTLLLGLEILPLWLGTYYACVALEKAVLAAWPSASSRGFFWLMVFISGLIATAHAALPTYLWLHPDPNLKYGALILLVAGVLNVFLVRARVWQISAAYMVPLAASFVVIAASTWQPPGGGPLFYTSVILASAIIVYFLVAVYEANQAHRRFEDTQRQFFQAQKMEAIGTLAGGIAHDFNNLLSVIQGNLELMQLSEDAEQRGTFASEAQTACWRGASLTRQLLALGRNAMLVPQRIDAGRSLFEVERLVRRVMPQGIGLTAEADTALPLILADETTLQAALLNLAINARDAMPDGGSIHFEARHITPHEARPGFLPPGNFVALSVSDTGTGIQPEVIGRVFDPFFSTKPKGGGTGLGLAMVEGFARQTGGHAHVESEPEKGSRFTLYLPAHANDRPPPETREADSCDLSEVRVQPQPARGART
ncbi:sensor histidine kinase [Vannielia litorea]|uniref:histidine kinase n=1 Tax=Vannielia litorea TaxID=1217970 RepID=A0A1N6DW37_9RHOB|nr:ATP-binding protein [Vannielia litorea]SIN75008.1 His Kinase A (phospho-acceptor) domain-containing protein [Vannielia litorea]